MVARDPEYPAEDFDVSSASEAVLGPLRLENPLVAMLVEQTALAQAREFGDGGWGSFLIAARILVGGLESPRSPADRRRTLAGLHEALAWCLEALEPEAAPLRAAGVPLALRLELSDLPSLLALLRCMVRPRRLPEATLSNVDLLCVLTARAFLQSLERGGAQGPLGVRTLRCPGQPMACSEVVEGAVLPAAELLPLDTREDQLPSGPLRVAAFAESLDIPPGVLNRLEDVAPLQAIREKVGMPQPLRISLFAPVLCFPFDA